jgi:hypothetical protein
MRSQGIAFASSENVQRVVSAARKQSDVVVASFHWGTEYANRPALFADRTGAHCRALRSRPRVGPSSARAARLADDRHARCDYLQSAATLVAYSLGNFVFDPARERGAAPTETIVLRCRLGKRGIVSAQAVPMKIDNTRPRPATAAESKAILARLRCCRANWAHASATAKSICEPLRANSKCCNTASVLDHTPASQPNSLMPFYLPAVA